MTLARILLSSAFLVFFTQSSVFAVDIPCKSINEVIDKDGNGIGLRCVEGVIFRLLDGIIVLVGLGLFIGLIMGGFKYLTAGGDEKAIQSARGSLTSAVVGFLIAVSVYFLLKVVGQRLLLPDLLRFDLPNPTVP